MQKRFISIWFRYLKTDWFTRRQPGLCNVPFVLVAPDHGRMIVTAANALCEKEGICLGMVLADARAMIPRLQYFDDDSELAERLLKNFGEWFIRYTPAVAIDLPGGLILDATGCAHLWGGEKQYLVNINNCLKKYGYTVNLGMADTIGAAWAVARFGQSLSIIESRQQATVLASLPAAAFRLEPEILERLDKLGLYRISSFINMPRPALRRRFGQQFLKRLDQALGNEEEIMLPIQPILPYQERLPCLEPIVTSAGIEIALRKLLDILCNRLQKKEKGLRIAIFKCYRVDGKIVQIQIGTNRPCCNATHLFKLFELKTDSLEPGSGIELFIMETPIVEDISPIQNKLWGTAESLNDNNLFELLDRIEGKLGQNHIHRYLPEEHYWPERSFKAAPSLSEKPEVSWKIDRPRPLQLLDKPQPVEVTAPVPDYPPMNFRYKGELHRVTKADGPERIEQEWWLQEGQHRDYYTIEDEEGRRYWLFRSGHYDSAQSYQWFIHGFFA